MKTGLLGGTFDPIHWGHLIVAEEAADVIGLDRVIFIPARIPPHKIGQSISATQHRMKMVESAIADNSRFEVSDYEVSRPGPTYTVETVQAFKQLYPNDQIYFIMGHDSFLEIETWYQYPELFSLCRLIVVIRPGTPPVQWQRFGKDVRQLFPDRVLQINDAMDSPRSQQDNWTICLVKIAGLDVSATRIRARVRSGRSIRYQVPDTVREYINLKRLYRRSQGKKTE